MQLTQEQQQVVDFDFSSTDTLLVNALAGTGKTSTLYSFAKKRPKANMLYLAFNKAIANEAKQKMPNNVKVLTCHSLAFREIGKDYKDLLTNNLKPIHIYDTFNRSIDYKEAHIVNIVLSSFFQSNAESIDEFLDNNESLLLWVEEEEASPKMIKRYAKELFSKMQNKESSVVHNFYLKLFQLQKIQMHYDYVLLDEAQDANDVILDIIANQKKAKKIIVGDHYQQIYKWNGSVDALRKVSKDKIMNDKPAIMYLTQSFRCSEKATFYANRYLKLLKSKVSIKPAPKAPQKDMGRAIIARTNAKLFESLINLKAKKVFYLGGFNSYNFEDLLDIQNIIKRNLNEVQNPFLKRFTSFAELEEYVESTNDMEIQTKIRIVKEHGNLVFKYYDDLKRAAAPREQAHVIATTAHKSKGQEFSEVILTDDYLDIRDVIHQTIMSIQKNKANTEPKTLSKEELNILYVAYTRSLKSINSPIPPPEDQDIQAFHGLIQKGHLKIK